MLSKIMQKQETNPCKDISSAFSCTVPHKDKNCSYSSTSFKIETFTLSVNSFTISKSFVSNSMGPARGKDKNKLIPFTVLSSLLHGFP